MFSTDASITGCPIPTTHKRLLDAHELWHQAANNYSNPDLLRTYLNATIQSLRNITFAVQNEKRGFNSFDQWYSVWQTRMKESSVLTWAKEARNRVVKQADLDTASMASVRLLTWRNDELVRVPIDPSTTSVQLIDHLPILELIARKTGGGRDLENAVLEVERQWNLPDLDDSEVLDTLAVAYGVLSDLVVDAHAHLGHLECIDSASPHSPFRAVHHRSGVLPCMSDTPELRVERFSLSTGAPIRAEKVRQTASKTAVREAASRYGISLGDGPLLQPGAEPDSVARSLVCWSKKMLQRDGYHIRVVFVRDGAGHWHPMRFDPSARSAKHVAIRLLSQFVRRTGGDAIIDIGEIWLTEVKRKERGQTARAKHVRKREALQVVAATRNGLLRLYVTPFSKRKFRGIKLEDTHVSDQEPRSLHYLYPVFSVWSKQGTRSGPDGQRLVWPWEPDPLDRCYCGSVRRFGVCCSPLLRRHSMKDLDKLGDEALYRSDVGGAERFARAAVAQYSIWIRQHTVPTQHVATALHRQLVDVDVPAMEAHVRRLDDILEMSGRGSEIVAGLRHLSNTVEVPKVRARMIAMAAERLYEVATRADAAAELDRIGDLETTTDATALRIAAHVFDRDHEDCCRLLRRATEYSEREHDRCAIELDLANEYRRNGRVNEALEVVDGVIERTQGKEELAEPRTAALDLRWRISEIDGDFLNARRELEERDGPHMKQRLLAVLVDHGDWEDPMTLAFDSTLGRDAVVQMLRIEVLLNADRAEEAREVAQGISTEQVTGRLRLRYAHTIGLVGLRARDAELMATAAGVLRSIDAEEGGLPSESTELLGVLDRVAVNGK